MHRNSRVSVVTPSRKLKAITRVWEAKAPWHRQGNWSTGASEVMDLGWRSMAIAGYPPDIPDQRLGSAAEFPRAGRFRWQTLGKATPDPLREGCNV